MSGCYGGSSEDRYFENQLNNHLSEMEEETFGEEMDRIAEEDCGDSAAIEEYYEDLDE